MGGGRFSNCSIIEALDLVENLANIKIKRDIIKNPRVGDHIWYISDVRKFQNHYPDWSYKYDINDIFQQIYQANEAGRG